METRKIADVVTPADIALLIRDKYEGDRDTDISEDLQRLASGEPLAYVIGWIPFLGLKIYLDTSDPAVRTGTSTRPLIPRPETEWWTEKLIAHLKYKFEDKPFTVLDLCAGSGAIGLAVLTALPNVSVSFGEIEPELGILIQKNIQENSLEANRAQIKIGDLFVPFTDERFDLIVSNPPYIPDTRNPELDKSVTEFEPHNALFSGPEGLDIINRISAEASRYLEPNGELWMECDISNIGEAENAVRAAGAHGYASSQPPETTIEIDQYGRPRLLIAHYT